MEISAILYSRIGELMQGVLPDASAFLVSGLPSRRWFSEATLSLATGMRDDAGVLPPKTREALDLLEERVGRSMPPGVRIELRSNIPWGKGLSSSSTDILSVLSVANIFFASGLSADELYRIAARVEPTDPVLSDEITVFYQHVGRSGVRVELPPVNLIYFDASPGTVVDTLSFRRDWPADAGEFFEGQLQQLIAAASAEDYARLFHAISSSAEYNQQFLPLPGFAELYRLAEEYEAAVLVAHSGTIAGLLTRPEGADELMERVVELAGASPVYLEHYQSSYHRTLCTVFPAH